MQLWQYCLLVTARSLYMFRTLSALDGQEVECRKVMAKGKPLSAAGNRTTIIQ